jgi:ATP-dependent DNA helicase RecQ
MDDLKTLRKDISEESGVPPYVVFHDATLVEMIQHRPANLNDMLSISGVGQAKLQKYGQAFLDVLQKHSL